MWLGGVERVVIQRSALMLMVQSLKVKVSMKIPLYSLGF